MTKLTSESGLVADLKKNKNKEVPEAVQKSIEETSVWLSFFRNWHRMLLCDSVGQGLATFFGKGPDSVILALQTIQSLLVLAIDNTKQMSGCVPIKLYLEC